MTEQQNRAALERAIEHWNSGDLPGYLDIYDPDTVLHGYPEVEPGLESIKRFYNRFWSAFPGCQIILHNIVSEGDNVGCRFVLNATHQGDFMGIPPTDKPVTLRGATILRFASGKCVERWSQADFLGILRQLGTSHDRKSRAEGPEENKALVRRFVDEAQSRGNIEAVYDFLAEDFVDHSAFPGFPPDREGVKQLFAALHAAFEDFQVTIHEQVAEDGKVVTYKTLHGMHQDPFMGVPPTGKRVAFDVIDILYVKAGRTTDHWTEVDLLGLMQQLGVVFGPEPAGA